jgi:hypothetical protein
MSSAHRARSASTWADACQALVRSCSIAVGSTERPGRLPSRDSRRCRELAEVVKVCASWCRDGPQPRTSATASMTAARSVTLCASSPDSRAAACRLASCDESDGAVPVVRPAAVLPEWARKMTTPATTAMSTAATIIRTGGRRERRWPSGTDTGRRPPSIGMGRSSGGTGPKPSKRVASRSAGGGCPPSGGTGHGCGADGRGGGHRGAYQDSQGVDSVCGTGAARGDSGDGNAGCGAVTAGNCAVDGWDGAALPVADCPHTGQNRDPGCTGCPHAGLPEPASLAIVTAG